jgi:hypothetical protein
LLFKAKTQHMKSLYLFTAMCLWCTGCATYQYATISSPLKNEGSEIFVVENETTKIMYDFSGEKGPVKISIYNKLQAPLYIDWNKSALIISDQRKSYSNKNSSLNAELNGTETRWINSTTQNATINGKITSMDPSGFIPPNAWATESQLKLSPDFFHLPAATRYTKKYVDKIIVDSFTYSQEQSPLNFRSFLTLSTQPDFSSPIYFDHAFWISEIFQTSSGPRKFLTKTDRFYLKKSNNAGAYVLAAGAVVGIVWTLQESKKALQD